MKTQSAKAKGRRLQKLVVSRILEFFPELSNRDVLSRPMGSQGTDVILSEIAHKKFPFAVECKNQEKNKGLIDMYAQAVANQTVDDMTALLVLGSNNSHTLVMLDLYSFMKLVRKAHEQSKV